jgi:hypothetical protein
MVGKIEISKRHIMSQISSNKFRISPYAQEMMCYLGQQKVYEEAEETLKMVRGIDVSAKQIENVCHYYGALLENQIEHAIAEGGMPPKQQQNKVHYVMLDGGMIFTREEKWKEMKLCRIFDQQENVLISKNRHCIGASTYIAHLGNHTQFLEKVEYHLDDLGERIFVADGAKWIWKWVEANYPQSTQILDFYHAKQHLCQWAEAVFKDPLEKENWIHTQCFWILNNGVATVIENLKQLKVSTSQGRKNRNILIEYYQSNKERMHYKSFREKGYMIGSGPIESAHRNVIQQRMKLSGQRWTMKGAQQIVNLRVERKSNNWKKVLELINRAA